VCLGANLPCYPDAMVRMTPGTLASARTARWILLGVLAVAVLLPGCFRARRGLYGAVPTMDAGQVERLRRVGEREMGCPRGALVMIPLTQNAVELRGCERIREYSLVCRRGRRCSWQSMTPAALLATRDLACPLEAMSVAAPSASTRDLVGCGRFGRYAIACTGDAVCRWNLLGPVAAELAPPPGYGASYGLAPAPPSAPSQAPLVTEVPPPPEGSVGVSAQFTSTEVPAPPSGSTAPR
jgi:hypothetical protein